MDIAFGTAAVIIGLILGAILQFWQPSKKDDENTTSVLYG